jgi:hypothetical protein
VFVEVPLFESFKTRLGWQRVTVKPGRFCMRGLSENCDMLLRRKDGNVTLLPIELETA